MINSSQESYINKTFPFGNYTFEYQWYHNCILNFEIKKITRRTLQDNLSRTDRGKSVSNKPFDIPNKFHYDFFYSNGKPRIAYRTVFFIQFTPTAL